MKTTISILILILLSGCDATKSIIAKPDEKSKIESELIEARHDLEIERAKSYEVQFKLAVSMATAEFVRYCKTNGPIQFGTSNDIPFLLDLPEICWKEHTNEFR